MVEATSVYIEAMKRMHTNPDIFRLHAVRDKVKIHAVGSCLTEAGIGDSFHLLLKGLEQLKAVKAYVVLCCFRTSLRPRHQCPLLLFNCALR